MLGRNLPRAEEHLDVDTRSYETAMRVLLVHAKSLKECGGAELSLQHHLAHQPPEIEADLALPDADVELSAYDVVVLANLRPAGGLGEGEEVRWAQSWTERLERYSGYAIRSERDVHPCTHRDARCVTGPKLRNVGCDCSNVVREAFEALYNRCDAVQYLSPAHRTVIHQLIEVRTKEFVIAAPIDLSTFRAVTPVAERKPAALILGDDARVSETAEGRARDAGFEPQRLPYLSVPHEQMSGPWSCADLDTGSLVRRAAGEIDGTLLDETDLDLLRSPEAVAGP
jgi:hypothetical protein